MAAVIKAPGYAWWGALPFTQTACIRPLSPQLLLLMLHRHAHVAAHRQAQASRTCTTAVRMELTSCRGRTKGNPS